MRSAIAANKPPASIAPSCSGSPTRTSFAPASSAWPITRARSLGADHPGLIDQQDRARGARRQLAAVKVAKQTGDGCRLQALGAKDVGRPPGRRCGSQLDSPPAPSLRLRRRWRSSCRFRPRRSRRRCPRARRAGGGPSRAGRPSGSAGPAITLAAINSPGLAARLACASARRPQAPGAQAPRFACVVKRSPFGVSADGDHRIGGEEGVGERSRPHGRRRAVGKQARRRPGSRRGGRSGRRGPSPRGRAAQRQLGGARPRAPIVAADAPRGQADLFGSGRASARAGSRRSSPFSFASRVVSVATWRARAEASAPAASRISARRVENVLSYSSLKPLISAMPLREGCHSMPSAGSVRGVDAPRRCSRRSWRARRSPGGRAGSSLPSGPLVALAISTWVCSWGSPFREERWR